MAHSDKRREIVVPVQIVEEAPADLAEYAGTNRSPETTFPP